jgi:hypothetical protein
MFFVFTGLLPIGGAFDVCRLPLKHVIAPMMVLATEAGDW